MQNAPPPTECNQISREGGGFQRAAHPPWREGGWPQTSGFRVSLGSQSVSLAGRAPAPGQRIPHRCLEDEHKDEQNKRHLMAQFNWIWSFLSSKTYKSPSKSIQSALTKGRIIRNNLFEALGKPGFHKSTGWASKRVPSCNMSKKKGKHLARTLARQRITFSWVGIKFVHRCILNRNERTRYYSRIAVAVPDAAQLIPLKQFRNPISPVVHSCSKV